MKMVILRKETESQENMEAWFPHILRPDSPLYGEGIIPKLYPEYVSCSLREKQAEFAFEVQEWQLNPEKGLHGGIIATQFDASFGILVHYFAKQNMVTTVQLAVNYLKPVLQGDKVHYKVKANSRGRTLVSLTGEAYLERDHILAATATATFMILDKVFEKEI